jgi:hypothetical protein
MFMLLLTSIFALKEQGKYQHPEHILAKYRFVKEHSQLKQTNPQQFS